MTEEERNRLIFLLQSKWLDIFKSLVEISQITMELLLEKGTKNEKVNVD